MNTINTTTNNSRLTLVSALADGKPSIVAEVLIKQGRTVKEVSAFSKTMAQSVKIAQAWFKEETKRKEQEERERLELLKERESTEQLIMQQATSGIEAAKQIYLNTLLAGGLDKEHAEKLVQEEFSNVFPMGKVTIQYKGKVFETSVKGKASDELKAVMHSTGMNRKQIIEHFAI